MIAELGIDTTDAHHQRIAISYTFVLDAEQVIHKIYNGWWYVGRPTVEELRMDPRALIARRRDWWYGDTPAPYAQVETSASDRWAWPNQMVCSQEGLS